MNGNQAPIVATLTEASAGYARSRESDGGPRQRQVLDRVDLEICSGELLAVLGRNGSGKTTLLRLLAGTLRPLTGSVELFGRPIGQWPRGELARRVAVLPQSRELPRGFTVSELVAMGRIPHARSLFGWGSEDEQAVERALADADASDLAHRPISELSGGERQRVVVAMALAQEPALLLLDEPTLHLDVRYQVDLARTLRRLCDARGVTVVAVLHDLNLAAAYADRCVLLDAGRLVPAGSEAGRVDAGRLGRALGIVVEEAATADGRRVLATVSTPLPGDPAA